MIDSYLSISLYMCLLLSVCGGPSQQARPRGGPLGRTQKGCSQISIN